MSGESPRHESRRPTLPATVWFAAALWAGATTGESASWGAYTAGGGLARAWAAVGIACAVALTCAYAARWPRAACVVLVGAALGGTLSLAYGGWWRASGAICADAGAIDWRGAVVGDPADGKYGPVVLVRLSSPVARRAVVRVGWPDATPVPSLGQVVAFSAVLRTPDAAKPWSRPSARRGECASGRAWRARTLGWRPGPVGALLRWRAAVARRVADIPGAGGDLLTGILLGDRRRVAGTPVEDDFRALGLSHVLAVSGDHLGLVALGIGALLRRARAPRWSQVLGTMASGAAFAVVTGFQRSALRALGMVVAAGSATLAGRRADGLAALPLAVTAIVACEPWSVFDVGLRLSVLAVGGLLLFGGLATEWTGAALPERSSERIVLPLAWTLTAQATTLPVAAATFGMVSIVAPVANVVVLPLIPPALTLGVCGALASPLAAPSTLLLRVAGMLLAGSAWVAAWIARLPGAAIPTAGLPAFAIPAWIAGIAAVWAFWPHPGSRTVARRLALASTTVMVAVALGPSVAAGSEIVVLDVGQGDAVLVRDGPHAVLVDTGPDGTALRRALGREGIRRLDGIILTHAHEDHTAGLAGLRGIVRSGWIAASAVETAACEKEAGLDVRGVPVLPVAAGSVAKAGRWRLEALWPRDGEVPESANAGSVVLLARFGRFSALLCGDAEADVLGSLAGDGLLPRVDMLKVPHHGSAAGLDDTVLEALRPRVAVISVGGANPFGHPTPTALRLLASHGARVLRTDRDGDVIVRVSATAWTVCVARRRGSRESACARMGAAPDRLRKAGHGDGRPERPQGGLPHPRRGTRDARSRGPPPA